MINIDRLLGPVWLLDITSSYLRSTSKIELIEPLV
jgi:hypothetical protein